MKKIKVIITDTDGVLTDGTVEYFNFSETKGNSMSFSKLDSKGFLLFKKYEVIIIVITSEKKKQMLEIVENRISDLNKKDNHKILLYTGINDKYKFIDSLLLDLKLKWSETIYVGDDESDFESLKKAKYGFIPNDSLLDIEGIKNISRLSKEGGRGCILEIAKIVEKDLIYEIWKSWNSSRNRNKS